ncbi:hypothetical protein JW835_08215 [bacterium]|nr:hypothetical protein [bacterium]
MKEVIEEILQEEKAARERVEKARENAKNIRLEAEKKSRNIVSKAHEQSQVEGKKLIENARKDAENEKIRAIEEAIRAGETLWDEKKEKIDKTVDKIFKRIVRIKNNAK